MKTKMRLIRLQYGSNEMGLTVAHAGGWITQHPFPDPFSLAYIYNTHLKNQILAQLLLELEVAT
jgi:hypothetical protein